LLWRSNNFCFLLNFLFFFVSGKFSLNRYFGFVYNDNYLMKVYLFCFYYDFLICLSYSAFWNLSSKSFNFWSLWSSKSFFLLALYFLILDPNLLCVIILIFSDFFGSRAEVTSFLSVLSLITSSPLKS
jgi:hypothetical protein